MLDMLIGLAGPVRRVQALLLSHKPPPDPLNSLSVLLEFEAGISGTLAAVRSTRPLRASTPLAAPPRRKCWGAPSSCCARAARNPGT